MDEEYRILLTIKDDLPIVVKCFSSDTTLVEAVNWMKENRKECHIEDHINLDELLENAFKLNVDVWLPVGRLIDQDGIGYIIALKFERKQADRDNAQIKVKLSS